MINPERWKYQTYDSTQAEQPRLSEPPAGKGRQDRRQKTHLLPPSSGAMGKGGFPGRSPGPPGSLCKAAPDFRILFWKVTKKYLAITGRARGGSPSQWLHGAALAGPSGPPCRCLSERAVPACSPTELRSSDLLVEQWRVVSGAAAPDPICKRCLQKRADLEARRAGLLFRCLVFIMQRFMDLLPPTPPGGEDQRSTAHRLMLLLSASMP